MLVLFIYVTRLASNEIFSLSTKLIIVIILISRLLIWLIKSIYTDIQNIQKVYTIILSFLTKRVTTLDIGGITKIRYDIITDFYMPQYFMFPAINIIIAIKYSRLFPWLPYVTISCLGYYCTISLQSEYELYHKLSELVQWRNRSNTTRGVKLFEASLQRNQVLLHCNLSRFDCKTYSLQISHYLANKKYSNINEKVQRIGWS